MRYGFVGKALDWLRSYLKERTQRVVIGDQSSSTTTLTTGVPQGSVLGPLLFSLYVQPIGDIIRAHGLFFHQYADDLHVYTHFDLTHSALVAADKDRQRNALSMPLSHHGLTTVTRSYTVRLQLTSPVFSVYKTRLPG